MLLRSMWPGIKASLFFGSVVSLAASSSRLFYLVLLLTCLNEYSILHLLIVAISVTTKSLLSILNLSNDNCSAPAQVHTFSYYLEHADGTRERRRTKVMYDDRSGVNCFMQTLLLIFAFPGFFMPMVLFYARRKRAAYYYVWWIMWITLHNVYSLVDGFVLVAKALMLSNLDQALDRLQASSALQQCLVLARYGITPLTIYLSFVFLRHYQRLSGNQYDESESECFSMRKSSSPCSNHLLNGIDPEVKMALPPDYFDTKL